MDSTPRIRLSGPANLIAAVPHLIGFPPEESLVLVGLCGPQSRLGLTMRADLPPDEPDRVPDVAELEPLAQALHSDGASECLAMIMTETPDRDGLSPYLDLVANLDEALSMRNVEASDIVLVRSGTWRSYLCVDPQCCPAQGSVLPSPSGELAAYAAYSGAVVRDSRAALVALLAPDGAAVAATERALDHVCAEMAQASASGASEAYRERIELVIDRRIRSLAAGHAGTLTHRDVARISVALIDRQLRDRVAGHCLTDSAAAAESLWIDLVRRLPSPLDAAPATLLALSSWARGDGAMANVALERALDSDRHYSLAQLVRTALDHALPPGTVREMLTHPAARAG